LKLLQRSGIGHGRAIACPSQKCRNKGCEIERKIDDDGKSQTKLDGKPDIGRACVGTKKELRQGGCEIKREWTATNRKPGARTRKK
jgi:hypothetical protein